MRAVDEGHGLLENVNRRDIFRLICSNPGINYRELMRRIGCSNGTISYHLHLMERAGIVRWRTNGRRKEYYVGDLRWGGMALSRMQRRILVFLAENPGLSPVELSGRLDISRQWVSQNLGLLRVKDIVACRSVGKRRYYYVTGRGIAECCDMGVDM